MSTLTSIYSFIKHAAGDTPWWSEVNANYDSLDSLIGRPQLPFNSPTVGATVVCDLNLGRTFVFTVSQATTLSFTNVPASLFVRTWLKITNGSAFLLTLPAAVTWLQGSAPVFKVAGVDWVLLFTTDGGTTWSGWHPVSTLYQKANLSTASTTEVSLTSYSVPGGTLAVDGASLRVRMIGLQSTAAGSLNIKFGATSTVVALIVNNTYDVTGTIFRTGAATQRTFGYGVFGGLTLQVQTAAPTETLSGAVLLDIRGANSAGGTLTLYGVSVELVAAQ